MYTHAHQTHEMRTRHNCAHTHTKHAPCPPVPLRAAPKPKPHRFFPHFKNIFNNVKIFFSKLFKHTLTHKQDNFKILKCVCIGSSYQSTTGENLNPFILPHSLHDVKILVSSITCSVLVAKSTLLHAATTSVYSNIPRHCCCLFLLLN